MSLRRLLSAFLLWNVLHVSGAIAQTPAASIDAARLANMRYRYIGPVGNRVAAIAGVPGDPNVYYAGAASGGVWKSIDGGIRWAPMFDGQPVQSIGALAVAPSDSKVVWAGTGEAWIRSHISVGNGIYKSSDAGATWQLMGLQNTGRIARVVIHPTNPNIVFAAALGHSYGPQQERGLYRTTDGGATWQKVLFVDANTGAVDVVMDPSDPNTLFAAMWQLEIHTWTRESGGPGSGLYVSHDGGTTWTKLAGNGLPTHDIGRIGLGISKTNPKHVYALIETGDGLPIHGKETDSGELWSSNDGGVNWRVASYDRNLACRQPYYTRLGVSTDNENEVYFMCASVSRTLDGGATLTTNDFTQPGGDNHDVWIDPSNANRIAIANDGGVSISTTRGRSWLRVQLPIAQIYHVTVDNRIPYFVYGNKQDGPSYRGPSNDRSGGAIERSAWHGVGGGESGWATPDTVDQNIVWSTASGSGSVGGIVTRMDLRNRDLRNVEVWPEQTGGFPAADVKYRFVWDAPFAISPHDHNRVYLGSQFVHVSSDGGATWQVISPDLTLNDKSKQQISGGLTPDNIGVEYGDVLHALVESPLQKDLLWAGTNDGLVHVSRNGGKTWTNVTPKLMPQWGTVGNIDASRYDPGTAYIAVDGHQANNFDPWIFKTSDFGKTWTLLVNGIPKGPVSYTHVVREDPARRGLLYAGTESGLFVSFNDGAQWQPLQNNLPHAPVYDIQIQKHFGDMVIATYGRGFWILDDLSALRQLTPEIATSNIHLFKPRDAYRFRNVPGQYASSNDPTAGENPSYGAAINYWLAAQPESAPKIVIEDATGQAVRALAGTQNVGFNRVYWDLRNEFTTEMRMRNIPAYAQELVLPKDSALRLGGRNNVLLPPGNYTVRLKVGTVEATQPLVVLKDPNTTGTEVDIRAQVALLMELYKAQNTASEVYNGSEVARVNLRKAATALADPNVKGAADLKAGAATLEMKFSDVEDALRNAKLTGHGQDGVRYPVRAAGQLNYLMDQVGGADFVPTSQQREVAAILKQKIDAAKAAYDALINQLASFNQQMKQLGLPPVVTP